MKNIKHHSKELNRVKVQRDIAILIGLCVTVIALGSLFESKRIISPCPSNGCFSVKVVYASEEVPEFEQIVSYITKKFAPEGKHVVVKAIACFYGESGLRKEAVGHNKNGTTDHGIPQINSIHTKRYGDKFKTDWKESINVAYKIYKSRGSFEAWYAPACR
jgi:hypothetical protein